MAGKAYGVDETQRMLSELKTIVSPLDAGTALIAFGDEFRHYLRLAPGRPLASDAKVSLGLALLDVWTLHSSTLDLAITDHSEAATLITLGATTALLGSKGNEGGESSDLARTFARLARERIEQAIKGRDDWESLWIAASKLGRQTGFRIEIDAIRAERMWSSLINFAADRQPLTFSPVPSGLEPLLGTITKRVKETNSGALAKIRNGWSAYSVSGGIRIEKTAFQASQKLHAEAPLRVSGPDGQELTVWFGTNREPIQLSDIESRYSNSLAAGELFYGRCVVNIPMPEDANGDVLRYFSRWLRLGSPNNSRTRVKSYLRFADRATFANDLKVELKQNIGEPSMLVFIHGYNTSFDTAAVSAAQLSAHIKHDGPTAMFSWASRAHLLHYKQDEDRIDASRAQLVEFLRTLTLIADLKHIDLVVHSLGNRLLLRSLIDWFTLNPPSAIPLRNLFLGAPDVAESEFLKAAARYKQAAAKTTLYGSDSDLALFMSKAINGSPRVGLMSPPILVKDIDSIETSSIDASRLGHNGIIDAAAIRADIFQIQEGKLDPDKRPNLSKVAVRTIPHWRF